MSDGINIQLDSADFERSAQRVTSALQEIKRAVNDLAQVRSGALRGVESQLESLKRSLTSGLRSSLDMAAAQAMTDATTIGMKISERIQAGMQPVKAKIEVEGSSLAQAFSGAARAKRESATAGDTLAVSSRKLAGVSNDLHSAARGVASGFNAMFLTWGNLAPLLAGAAVSNTFVQVVKTGSEVEHTLEMIRVLGENASTEMKDLRKSLDDLAISGPNGPKELVEAMKTLSLAGLGAGQIKDVMKDVQNFSIAGDVALNKSADTLVSVATAFGMSTEGYGRIADIISKAAAMSKSSVEGVANSMKTASVINKQYGVSLEDTATGLAALSQLGIEGTSAGTALRNMYADLSGRSQKVTRILKEQNIELRDTTTGGFKPLVQMMRELSDTMSKFTPIGQKNFIQAIAGERGGKGLAEFLDLLRQAPGDLDKFSSKLQEWQTEITNSYGFASVSAAEMSLTIQNQLKQTVSTFQDALLKAFDDVAPALRVITDALQKAFQSSDFQSTIGGIASAVGNLAVVVAENSKVFLTAAEAYAITKAAAIALTSMQNLLASSSARATVATEANTAATLLNNEARAAGAIAAQGAAGAVERLAGAFGIAGKVIQAALLAYTAYEWWQAKSNDTADKAADLHGNQLADALKKEADRLEERNKLLERGVSLQMADLQLRGEAAKQSYIDDVAKVHKDLERQRDDAQSRTLLGRQQLDQLPHDAASYSQRRAIQAQVSEDLAKAEDAVGKLRDLDAKTKAHSDQIDANVKRIQDESQKTAEWLKSHGPKPPASGNTPFSVVGPGGSARSGFSDASKATELLLKKYKEISDYDDQIAAVTERKLKTRYDRGLLTYEQYQGELDKVQKQHLDGRLKMLMNEESDLDITEARMRAAAAVANAKKPGSVTQEALKNQLQSVELARGKIQEAMQKASDSADAKQEAIGTRALAPLTKARQEAEKLVSDSQAHLDVLKQQTAEHQKMLGLSDRDRAIEEAAWESQKKFLTEGLKLRQQIAEARRKGFAEEADAAQSELDKLKRQAAEDAAGRRDAAGKAYDLQRQQSIKSSLDDGISGAMVKGLTGDGQGAEEQIKSMLAGLLQKQMQDSFKQMLSPLTSGLSKGIGGLFGGLFGGIDSTSTGDPAKDLTNSANNLNIAADALQRAATLMGGGGAVASSGGIFSALRGLFTSSDIASVTGEALATYSATDLSGLMFLASGGYTGPGGKYEPAGIVHRGEYVLNQAATSRIGIGALDRMNGFADGGYTGDPADRVTSGPDVPGRAPGTHGATPLQLRVSPVINIDSRSDKAQVAEMVAAGMQKSQDNMVKQLRLLRVIR